MAKPHRDQTVLPRISDFYSRLFSQSWLGLVLSQIILIGIIIFAIAVAVRYFDLDIILMVAIIVLLVIESVIGYIFLKYALYPVDMISRALIQICGENSTVPPPDRSDPRIAKTGLELLLNKLYELDTQAKARSGQILPDDVQLMRDLFANLPVGVIALNSDREIIASNKLAPTYAHAKDQQAIQLDFANSADSLSEWLNEVENNQIEAEKIWSRVQNLPPDENRDADLADSPRRIYDVVAQYKKDSPSGIETVIITIDRTAEYLETEENMDFIVLAAHELRGPITVIRGYLDILDEQLAKQLSPEQHEMINRLNVSAHRLSAYVNNILNASRYDRHHLQLKLSEDTVENLINDIADDMELRARTLNRQLDFRVPHDLPTVAVDRSSISEVLSNLIDNAIKYSHDGGQIIVSAEQDGDFVAISVQDFGIGIPPAIAEHLFSKFYRSHRSRGAVSGSGLGLYISRAIVESHGGHIGVESSENEGSTFTFTLPIFATVADKIAKDNSALIRDKQPEISNHGFVEH